MLRRLFSLVSAFAVLFFCSVPAFATAVEPGGTGGGIGGIPVIGNINLDVVDFFDYMRDDARWAANAGWHYLIDEDVCPYAPQLGGGHNFVPRRTLKDGQIGKYYVCEYCGKAYGEAMEEAYDEYVDTLPTTQVNSGGYFRWIPSASDFNLDTLQVKYCSDGSTQVKTLTIPFDSSEPVLASNCAWTLFPSEKFVISGRGANRVKEIEIYWPTITLPWTATYLVDAGSWQSGSYSGLLQEGSIYPSGSSAESRIKFFPFGHQSYSGSFDLAVLWPYFWVEILSVDSSVGDSISAHTRPSISVDASSGDNSSLMLGYMDNGNLVQSQSQSAVFSESANVYTNPVTNNTKTVTSWDYDYTDRSYTLTTNEGEEITVTYGDTNLTINEGGETYNLYYLVEHDDTVPCSHSYSGQITQAPTCTSGGVKTYVCSICGESYAQELPATGHSYSSSVTQEPTCTAPGRRTLVCSVCGDTRTETIAATGHSYSSEVTTAPTCTASGVRTSVCSVCGDTRTDSIAATGHSYVSEVAMEPTCATTGVRTFTCSVCGDSYNRSIPATGHRWRILRTVSNQYGEDGQLEQAGYTLYECDTCGEQYRIDAASSGSELPLPSSGGTSTGTELQEGDTGDGDSDVGAGFLLTIARGLTEDLPEVLKMVSQWFTTIPALFDGYSKFLAASFSWLPEECAMLIIFGVHMVVLLGILKACFRR